MQIGHFTVGILISSPPCTFYSCKLLHVELFDAPYLSWKTAMRNAGESSLSAFLGLAGMRSAYCQAHYPTPSCHQLREKIISAHGVVGGG
jgi:hypothetical protein